MAEKIFPRRLTLPELGHLSAILCNERENGSYYGPREQYYNRTERLIQWCSEQIKEIARRQNKEIK